MPTLSSIARKCAVCGATGTEFALWFTADISCDRMALHHAGEAQEPGSSEIHFCCEEHAGQFLVAWLLCEGERAGNRRGPVTVLPRSDEFHLRTADAAVELSLSRAIQTFWEEGVRDLEYESLAKRLSF